MKRTILVFIAVTLIATLVIGAGGDDIEKEKAAIRKAIEESYIRGILIDRNVKAIRKGFHPEFNMFLFRDGAVTKWSIDHWIDVVEKERKNNPSPPEHEITHEFTMIDVTGNAAVARVEIYRGGKQTFTDYLSLYKLKEGWKIVGKIYYRH